MECQKPITVNYNNQMIGEYKLDLFVENKIIVELKALSTITNQHRSQILNYLKASNLNVGLILNFGNTSLQIERKIWK